MKDGELGWSQIIPGLSGHGKGFGFWTTRNGKPLKDFNQERGKLPLHCLKFPEGQRPFLGVEENLNSVKTNPSSKLVLLCSTRF